MTPPERPPRRWARWLLLGVVAVVVLVVLFTLVFPWIERNLSNPTIGAAVVLGAPVRLRVMPGGW